MINESFYEKCKSHCRNNGLLILNLKAFILWLILDNYQNPTFLYTGTVRDLYNEVILYQCS